MYLKKQMAEKIKIFFSYQWATEDTLRAAVVADLKNNLDNVEFIVDKDVIEASDNIHKTISQKLDECDCILVSLESLDSKEVSSELIRADERGKIIFLLQKKGNTGQIPSHLYFLEDRLRITYTSIDDLNNKLVSLFRHKKKEEFEVIPNSLRLVQKNIKDLRELPKFKADLIKRILQEERTEIAKIKNRRYNFNVGIEKNFLVRASSIFQNASEIYAVSLDTVSTFWTDKNNRKLAENYIKTQPNNTVRLFVFSSIRAANKYKYILQANHNSYGESGRVFICSLYSYKHLLEKFINKGQVETYLNKDFGILVYNEGQRRDFVEALLDHSELTFQNIDISQTSNIDHQGLLYYFQKLKNDLDFEKISEGDLGRKKIYIKRWNPKYISDPHLWRDDLKRLFPEERSGDAYHLVFFKDSDGQLEERILEAKNSLNRLRDSLKIKSIWFGKKTERIPVADFQFGQLKVSFDYEYVLIMSFASHEDLRSYYSNPQHSRIRRDLYTSMSRSLELLYEYLDQLPEQAREIRQEIFERTVEEVVLKYMIRYDFVDKEDINSIVRESPYEFSYSLDV